MKRVLTKIGDIFAVKIDDDIQKFFQLIAYDLTQLNSDVIRAFEKKYPLQAEIDSSEIVMGKVEFYAHCITKSGVRLGYWAKIGRSSDVGELDHILFRDTNDYGHAAGSEPITLSNRWYIWHIGDLNFTSVGRLEGENRKAEIGVVMDPESIVNRMTTGEYGGFYPDYE